MNATVYLFGEFNSGYTQYPDDFTTEIFHSFYTHAKSTTQIAIRRDGALMYYGYIRKLEQARYIGLCAVLNGLMLTRIDGLFSLFENTITALVTKGHLIHFNEHGDIVTNVEKLYMNRDEIDILNESLCAGFNRLANYTEPLPPVNYAISKDSVKDFSVTGNQEDIIKSSHSNGYTYIYKSEGYNTAQLTSYQDVLAKTSREKEELLEKIESQKEEQEKAVREALAKAEKEKIELVRTLKNEHDEILKNIVKQKTEQEQSYKDALAEAERAKQRSAKKIERPIPEPTINIGSTIKLGPKSEKPHNTTTDETDSNSMMIRFIIVLMVGAFVFLMAIATGQIQFSGDNSKRPSVEYNSTYDNPPNYNSSGTSDYNSGYNSNESTDYNSGYDSNESTDYNSGYDSNERTDYSTSEDENATDDYSDFEIN